MEFLKPPEEQNGDAHFEDTVSTTESAKKAIAAAQAAAYLANRDFNQATQATRLDNKSNASSINHGFDTLLGKSTDSFMPNENSLANSYNMGHQLKDPRRRYESQSFGRSQYISSEETQTTNIDGGRVYRRHSYNPPFEHSDIKFNESKCAEEMEMEEPPSRVYPPPERPPPSVPSYQDKHDPAIGVHPKLPDFDALAACFEALKYRKH
ncbi:hypothetical protein CJ030_MR7G009319 [Morella rubra]|uniref:IST1-like protein n=1 Tax=Morella rubra TaxID=262757 RepID=A0A6A1V4B3_9ROSI|nr:hypothetical protein CJ030_MR7G009319 [Morella rubra]